MEQATDISQYPPTGNLTPWIPSLVPTHVNKTFDSIVTMNPVDQSLETTSCNGHSSISEILLPDDKITADTIAECNGYSHDEIPAINTHASTQSLDISNDVLSNGDLHLPELQDAQDSSPTAKNINRIIPLAKSLESNANIDIFPDTSSAPLFHNTSNDGAVDVYPGISVESNGLHDTRDIIGTLVPDPESIISQNNSVPVKEKEIMISEEIVINDTSKCFDGSVVLDEPFEPDAITSNDLNVSSGSPLSSDSTTRLQRRDSSLVASDQQKPVHDGTSTKESVEFSECIDSTNGVLDVDIVKSMEVVENMETECVVSEVARSDSLSENSSLDISVLPATSVTLIEELPLSKVPLCNDNFDGSTKSTSVCLQDSDNVENDATGSGYSSRILSTSVEAGPEGNKIQADVSLDTPDKATECIPIIPKSALSTTDIPIIPESSQINAIDIPVIPKLSPSDTIDIPVTLESSLIDIPDVPDASLNDTNDVPGAPELTINDPLDSRVDSNTVHQISNSATSMDSRDLPSIFTQLSQNVEVSIDIISKEPSANVAKSIDTIPILKSENDALSTDTIPLEQSTNVAESIDKTSVEHLTNAESINSTPVDVMNSTTDSPVSNQSSSTDVLTDDVSACVLLANSVDVSDKSTSDLSGNFDYSRAEELLNEIKPIISESSGDTDCTQVQPCETSSTLVQVSDTNCTPAELKSSSDTSMESGIERFNSLLLSNVPELEQCPTIVDNDKLPKNTGSCNDKISDVEEVGRDKIKDDQEGEGSATQNSSDGSLEKGGPQVRVEPSDAMIPGRELEHGISGVCLDNEECKEQVPMEQEQVSEQEQIPVKHEPVPMEKEQLPNEQDSIVRQSSDVTEISLNLDLLGQCSSQVSGPTLSPILNDCKVALTPCDLLVVPSKKSKHDGSSDDDEPLAKRARLNDDAKTEIPEGESGEKPDPDQSTSGEILPVIPELTEEERAYANDCLQRGSDVLKTVHRTIRQSRRPPHFLLRLGVPGLPLWPVLSQEIVTNDDQICAYHDKNREMFHHCNLRFGSYVSRYEMAASGAQMEGFTNYAIACATVTHRQALESAVLASIKNIMSTAEMSLDAIAVAAKVRHRKLEGSRFSPRKAADATGFGEFVCSQCPFRGSRYRVKSHIVKMHTTTQPFECHVCHKVLKSARTLAHHFKGKHPDLRPALELKRGRKRKISEVIAAVIKSVGTPIKINQSFMPKTVSAPAIISSANKKTTPAVAANKKTTPAIASNKKTTPAVAANNKITPAVAANKKSTPANTIEAPVATTSTKRRYRRKCEKKAPSIEPSALKDMIDSIKKDDMKMIDDDFIVVMNKDSSDEEEEEQQEEQSCIPGVSLGTIVVAPIDNNVVAPASSFQCEMCNVGFVQVWELEVHCATIHLSRMIKCSLCAFYTIIQGRYSEHLARAHPVLYTAVCTPPLNKVSECTVKIEPLSTPDVQYRSSKTSADNAVHRNDLIGSASNNAPSVKPKQKRKSRAKVAVVVSKVEDEDRFVIGNVRSIKDARVADTHLDPSVKARPKGLSEVTATVKRHEMSGSVLNGASSITLEDDELGTVTVNKLDDDDDDDDDEADADQGRTVVSSNKSAAVDSNVAKKHRAVPMVFHCPQCPDRDPFRYRKSFDNHLRQHGLDPSLVLPESPAKRTPIKSLVEKEKTPLKNDVDVQVRPYVINPYLTVEEIAPIRPVIVTPTNLASFSYDNESSEEDVVSSDTDSPENTRGKILSPRNTSKQVFPCPQCPDRAPFQYRKSFRKHMLQHGPAPRSSGVKGDFYCPTCPDRAPFHYKKSYDNHLRMHALAGVSVQLADDQDHEQSVDLTLG